MTTITLWHNASNGSVRFHQLSADPEDGTVEEQVAYLATLTAFEGFSYITDNYTGIIPDVDASLWRWDGNAITAIVPVPGVVSRRQARLLLLGQGLLDQVEAMMATQDRAAQITWQDATEFKRNDPLLKGLATNLGLTEEQIDQFFIAAAQL